MSTVNSRQRKMRGFMCQSSSSTALCMTTQPIRSVIVPRRADKTILVDNTRLISSVKYSKLLIEPNNLSSSDHHVMKCPSIPTAKQEDQEKGPNNSLQVRQGDDVFQIVMMRVSLHCQGCASKVRKHLSKMEGVTSFSIDLESKRVTVMGNISPVGVLESISKVKKAEFWPC